MDFQTYENLAEEADNAGKDQTKERLELEVLQAKDEVVDNLEQKKRFFYTDYYLIENTLTGNRRVSYLSLS